MKAIYAVLVLKISEFSKKEMESISEKVHPLFKETHPHSDEQQANSVRIEIDEKGATNQHIESTLLLHRSSPNKKSAISITKSQLAYHSINFTDSSSFVADGMSAFMKVKEALDIKFFGQISARYIDTFDFDSELEGNPFVGFNGTHLIAPPFSSFPQMGASSLQTNNADSESSVQSILKVSVAIQERLLPNDLADSVIHLFNFGGKVVPIFARIDIDSIFTNDNQLSPFDSVEIQRKLTIVTDKAEALYKEIQEK